MEFGKWEAVRGVGKHKHWCVEDTGDSEFFIDVVMDDPQEESAIAHLIAASPDLLEALRAAEWVEHDPDPYPVFWECPACGRRLSGISRPKSGERHASDCILATAIRKAEGQHDV